jgi:hypothetical protein
MPKTPDADRLDQYIRRGRSRVAGWLSRCDAEMFRALLAS